MKVRCAGVDDARLLAELNQTVQQLHADTKPEIFKPHIVTDNLVESFRDMLSKAETHIFIAEANGAAVGYLVAKVVHRPESPFTMSMNFISIEQLCVNVDYQGRGCGRLLMDAAYDLARAQNISRLMLGVWSFNSKALEFYRRQGFQTFYERMEIELG